MPISQGAGPAIGPFASAEGIVEVSGQNKGIMAQQEELRTRVADIERILSQIDSSLSGIIQEEIRHSYVRDPSLNTLNGLQLALCVATDDPYKEGRVRFWHPMMHSEIAPFKSTDWAKPISVLGGFDDSGVHWVPPAGSLLALLFVNGHRDAPFYIGTVWNRERNNPPSFGIAVPEYSQLWVGGRGGYLFGDQNGPETQVLPPSNTESYNGFDITNTASLESSSTAADDVTNPNIYQMKTNEKHSLKFVDGAKKFKYRGKRLEMFSARGNIFLMKDDHLNPAGQHCNPKMECDNPVFQNKYAKHRSEQQPYCGPPTPCREKCRVKLKQSGIHMQTIGGHYWFGDDEVEEPYGIPTWELPFTFGLTDKCLGKTEWGSMTGHSIKMDDKEDEPQNRSDVNGIRMESACGQFLELNDHTVNKKKAGAKRGVHIRSSSLHELIMRDTDNEQASPIRCGPGDPKNEAKEAFVMLRSGYGLMLRFVDSHQQKTTESQVIQLLAPNYDDKKDSHLLQMQLGGGSGVADETGGAVSGIDESMVLLRSGNIIVYSSRNISVEAVGDNDNTDSTAHKFVSVKGHHIVHSDGVYVNENKLALIKSKEYIILGAGEDCEEKTQELQNQDNANTGGAFGTAIENIDAAFGNVPDEEDKGPHKGPCLYPVIVGKDPWPCPLTGFIHFGLMCGEGGASYNAMSNRCFASSNPKEKPDCSSNDQQN